MSQLGDDASVTAQGLKTLWKHVATSKAVMPWPKPGKPPSERTRTAEVYVCRAGARVEYAVNGARFRRLLPDVQQRALVVAALRHQGLVKMDGNNPMSQPQILGRADKRRFSVVSREKP